MNKKIYILRHAKSDWSTDTPTDFERPLNKRGMRNASEMGQWMATQGIIPDVVICSTAQRARQTITRVCTAMGIDESNIEYNSELYLASLDELLSAIRSLPEQIESVMLVGHNPGLEELLIYLVGSTAAISIDRKILPTATLAQLKLSSTWLEAKRGSASMITLTRPKEL